MSTPPSSNPSTHHTIAKIKSLFYSNNPTQCFALCSQLLSSSQDLHPLHTSTLHFYTALLHEDIARSSPLPSTILRACEKALSHYNAAIAAVECLVPSSITTSTSHQSKEEGKQKEKGKVADQSDTYNLDDLLSPSWTPPPEKQEGRRVDSPFEDLDDTSVKESCTVPVQNPHVDTLELLQPVAFQRPSAKPLTGVHSPKENHISLGVSNWVCTLRRMVEGVRELEVKAKISASYARVKKVRFALGGREGESGVEDEWVVKERKNAWKRKGGYGCRDVGRWRRERFDAGGVRRFCEEVVGEMGG